MRLGHSNTWLYIQLFQLHIISKPEISIDTSFGWIDRAALLDFSQFDIIIVVLKAFL